MAGEAEDFLPILELLCAPKKLDREKGEEQFRSLKLSQANLIYLRQWIFDKLEGLSNWEDVYGGLTVAQILLENLTDDQLKALGLLTELDAHVIECHDNWEYRVRIASGQVMGLLCRRSGLDAFKRFLPKVLEGITLNLERSPDAPATESENSLRELIVAKDREVNASRSTLSIFHDTAGWKNLETWMKCLQQMVSNLKPEDFVQVDRSTILDLVFKAVDHVNRFVRETGYEVLTTLILGRGCHNNPASDEANYVNVAKQLVKGLSDNWSQVRMAASRAVRTFFEVPPPPGHDVTDVYPLLLPPMCLNRYYVAEGVRIYSQDTWCRVTKGEGKRLLGCYIGAALDYYIKETDADNHAVREAACAAIAEAASKLSPELLQPYSQKLLDTLLICFADESWPVRDAACAALGTLISTFVAETKAAGHDDLLADQFLRNLSDSIPSVRDVAADSITRVIKAASDPNITKIYRTHIATQLTNVSNQPAESHGAEASRIKGTGPGASHVIARRGADAHDARHTDQVMYSCGSLAPKLQKGRKAGGCHDGLHQRPSEPWECADGALRLIGSIAEHAPELFTDDMVEQMLKACEHKHYAHHPYLLETACRVIVQLCAGLDKVRFKRHLDELLVVLAESSNSELPLATVASEETLDFLSKRIGPNVLRGRIENHVEPCVSRALLRHLPPTN